MLMTYLDKTKIKQPAHSVSAYQICTTNINQSEGKIL